MRLHAGWPAGGDTACRPGDGPATARGLQLPAGDGLARAPPGDLSRTSQKNLMRYAGCGRIAGVRPPSSRGLGRGPFKAKTGVRIPLGALQKRGTDRCAALLFLFLQLIRKPHSPPPRPSPPPVETHPPIAICSETHRGANRADDGVTLPRVHRKCVWLAGIPRRMSLSSVRGPGV